MSSARPFSIRRRLRRDALLVIAALWVLNTALGLGIVIHAGRLDLDEDLELLAALIAAQRHEGKPQLPERPTDVVYQVVLADGRVALASGTLGDAPLALRGGYSNRHALGHALRVYVAPPAADGSRVIVAAPTWNHQQGARTLALWLLLPLTIGFPMLAAAISIVVGRATRAVADEAEAVACRDPDDFEPVLVERLPEEVRPLASAFNALMQRLATALDDERRFNDSAAHELRTPLSAIRVDAQALLRRVGDADVAEVLRRIVAASTMSARLVEELMLIARLSDWPAAAHGQAQVPVAEVVDLVLHDLDGRLAERRLQVDVRVDDGTLAAMPEAVHLILRNLVENAISHARGATGITIAARERDGMLQLSVMDDGCGIPSAQRVRVFERFVRFGEDGRGTGLGLYIVRRIAERLGGQAIAGEAEGGGALFVVLLPVRRPPS